MAAQSVTGRITKIEKAGVARKGAVLVTVELDDGDVSGPWTKKFIIIPESTLSLDDLVAEIVSSGADIHRPADPLAHLKEAMQNKVTFEIPLYPRPLS